MIVGFNGFWVCRYRGISIKATIIWNTLYKDYYRNPVTAFVFLSTLIIYLLHPLYYRTGYASPVVY